MNKIGTLQYLINYADHLDKVGLTSYASLIDYASVILSDIQKNTDLVKNSDSAPIALAKCADYLDDINQTASDVLDRVLVIIANEEDAGRYGPISQFNRLDHSKAVYNTESPDKKQEKRKRNDEHSVKGFGESGSHLNTRYCPDHHGVQTSRIGERVYQCSLDKKIYNYETGYTNYKGENIPGGSVAHQTPESSDYFAAPSRIFDSRENLMNPIV